MLNEAGVEFDFGAGVVLTGGGIGYFDGGKQLANSVFGLPVRVYPDRNFKSQRVDSTLAEGIVKHVTKTGGSSRYGSDVLMMKSREQGIDTSIFSKIINIIKRIF